MKKSLNLKSIWIPSIVLLCVSLLFSIILGIMFATLPFPERFTVAEMSKVMIASGQASLLVMIYFTGSFAGISFFVTFALAIVAFKNFFLTNKFFKYITATKKKYTKFMVALFFYVFISLIFILAILYFFLDYQKYLNQENESNENNVQIQYSKNYKHSLQAITISGSCLIVLTPTIALIGLAIDKQVKISQIPNRYNDIQQMYTLSSNKPNTIILYFDRGLGLFYNLLAIVDYCLYGKDSLIVKYPEFTSYINVLSNCTLTVGSNPSINGSWFMLPKFKNNDKINPFTGIANNKMDMNDWFLTAYKQSTELFQYYQYQNLGIYNAPYYGNKSHFNQANAQELQTDLAKELKPTTNIKVIDSSETAKALGMHPSLERTDDAKTLQNFASHSNAKPLANNQIIDNVNYGKNRLMKLGDSDKYLNLSVANQASTFLFNHFHTTHETYTYVKDKDSISPINPDGVNHLNPSIGKAIDIGNSVDGLIVSIWYSIQKIKNIFDYLKNLPYDGPNSDVIKNQYDNTNIYVIADHGYTIFNKSKVLKQILEYLKTKKYLSSKQIDYLLKDFMENSQDVYGANTVFMVKERKYLHQNWNKQIDTSNYVKNFFNLDKILSLADLMPIIDANLQKNIKDNDASITDFVFNPAESWYNNSQIKNWAKQNPVDPLIKTNFLLDPLNQSLDVLRKRKLPICGVGWHFVPKSYYYQIYMSILFDCTNAKNTIFTENCIVKDN